MFLCLVARSGGGAISGMGVDCGVEGVLKGLPKISLGPPYV